jgi:hypothetical protein
MGYRINERNTGSINLNGGLKVRRASKKLTDADKNLIQQILEKVQNNLKYDKIMSDGKGQHNPESIFTGGEGFTIAMTREQLDQLWTITYEKLK